MNRFALILLGLAAALVTAALITPFCGAPVVAQPAALQIRNVQANTTTVGLYEKLELTFEIAGTVATNPYFPFDPSPPPGIPAGVGISVDGLFSPDNWTTVITQPAFLYQDYERRCVYNNAFVTPCPEDGEEWLYPVGAPVWKVRFAPQQPGTWRYRIRVTDASGTVQSAEGTFTVTLSTNPDNHGFIRIAHADPGYFEYSDGTPFIGVGHGEGVRNWRFTYDADEMLSRLASGRVNFTRIWMTGASIYMAPWNPWNSHHLPYEGGYFNAASLTYTVAYTGHLVSLRLWDYADPGVENRRNPCMFQGFTNNVAVKPNTTYLLRVRLRTVGVTGPRNASYPYGFTVRKGGWLGEDCADPAATSGDSTRLLGYVNGTTPWHEVTATFTTGPNERFLDNFYLILENTTGGNAFVDEVSLREFSGGQAVGPEVLRKNRFAYHLYFDPQPSWQWDYLLEQAARHGVTVRPVVLEKNDWIANHLDANGNPVGAYYDLDNNRFYAAPDTAVRRYHEYFWRYLIARWGYSRAVHSWELLNEGDPYNGNHYVMADAFGRFMKAHDPHRHLVTTSHWHSFPLTEFWANPAYSSVDYADIHEYACCGNRYAAWANTIGDPLALETRPQYVVNGRGASVRIPGGTQFNNAGETPRSLAIRGQGEWIIRYQMKTENFAGSCPYGDPPSLAGPRLLWILDNGTPQGRANVVPPAPSGQDFVCSAPAGTYDWRTFDSRYTAAGDPAPESARLIVNDDNWHPLIIAFQNGFGTGGTAWIDNVELIAPDGRRAYLNGEFDPTVILSDTAHLTSSLSQQIGGRAVTGPRRPVTRGEVAVGDDTDYRGDDQHAQVNDTEGVWLHNFVWGQINAGGLYELYWDPVNIRRYNLYHHFKAFRDFMDGIPLNNGRYEDAQAVASHPDVIPLGQADRASGGAHLWIRHRQYTWWNVVNNAPVTPVSATVTVPAMADGFYRVTWWDAWNGRPLTTTAAVASSNLLTLTLPSPLTGTVAVRVEREWPAHLYLPLVLLFGNIHWDHSLWIPSEHAAFAQTEGTLTPRLWLPLVLRGFSPGQPPTPPSATYALRFYGTGTDDIDRVKIPISNTLGISLPVNIGANDFTLEFWLRFAPGENGSGPCQEGEDAWINGNIIFDRDIFGTPDYGDFGISLYGGRIAFGVHNGSSGYTICGNTTLTANQWHHVAVTRRTNGEMRIFVNGMLARSYNGPAGNISYRVGRSAPWPNEPYLVIGAEKHDYDPSTYPSFSGWIDEVRISNVVRYTANFTPPNAPFTTDANTVGLYHFDEGSGTTVLDSSNAPGGPSHGERQVGGPNNGPVYDAVNKRF